MFDTDDLDGWLAEIRTRLAEAAATPGHPWRTPVLGTTENDRGRLRTVVLRAVAPDLELTFYSDSRGAKAHQIARQPYVEWLFYHPEWRVQLRVEAAATMQQHTPDCQRIWRQMDATGRSAYRSLEPPGTPMDEPGDGLPASSRPDAGLAHFMIVETAPSRLDCVVLRPTGNRRAIWAWADDEWIGSWVTP